MAAQQTPLNSANFSPTCGPETIVSWGKATYPTKDMEIMGGPTKRNWLAVIVKINQILLGLGQVLSTVANKPGGN
jgi:hypothetical protein